MKTMRWAAMWLALLTLDPLHAAPVQAEHVEAELVSEYPGLQAGAVDNWVALRLKPEPGWHVYWQNPGDSGIPTRLDWQLPDGVSAGPIQWPLPHRHALGPLVNYGYGEETLHLVALRLAPERAQAGSLRLAATAKWLVCADICIPGEAQLQLELPVTQTPGARDPRWASYFDKARAELPRPMPGWSARYAVDGQDFSMSLAGPQLPEGPALAFFPVPNDLVAHAAPQRMTRDADGSLRLSQKLSPYFVKAVEPVEGVLVAETPTGPRAYQVSAVAGSVAPVPESPVSVGPAATSAPQETTALPAILAFALLGGLILNLMPCVFPVLALKALSVMKAGALPGGERRRHALSYTSGVLLSFALMAAVLIGLRAGGEALGWGFQLQSPVFVTLLAYLMFAVGFSLSGAVSFGTGWMGLGQSLAERGGLGGSFFTGVLAVVVASPCTAPFMAPALGYALTQPAVVSLLVFLTLGLGLALPFLILGFAPGLARLLPRPGRWMETLKQILAYPMYLTAIWLLWVLGGLSSRDGMALGLVGILLLALGLWMRQSARSAARWIGVAAILLALALPWHPLLRQAAPATPTATSTHHETYSDARFAELRAQGRSVFVDFTADWCLTCKLNERGALRSRAVRDTFEQQDVVTLVGDWTRADPEITAVLQRYGRSGVPLYLASHKGAEPVVLPQVLTPGVVADAFR